MHTNLSCGKNFWKDSNNQRRFLIQFAKKFGIQQPDEWGRVSFVDIKNGGGATLLINHHQSNLQKALIENFPDIDWKRDWFHRSKRVHTNNYWSNPNNAKTFLSQLASKLGINQPQDWGRISLQTIKEHKGRYLLDRHRGSLFLTLQSVFPGLTVLA